MTTEERRKELIAESKKMTEEFNRVGQYIRGAFDEMIKNGFEPNPTVKVYPKVTLEDIKNGRHLFAAFSVNIHYRNISFLPKFILNVSILSRKLAPLKQKNTTMASRKKNESIIM